MPEQTGNEGVSAAAEMVALTIHGFTDFATRRSPCPAILTEQTPEPTTMAVAGSARF